MFSLAVQNAVPAHQLGVATSSSQFVRQLGSTIGVAVFGALITASLSTELGKMTANEPAAAVRHLQLSDLQQMAVTRSAHPGAAVAAADAATERLVRKSFSVAIVHSLIFGAAILVLGFLIMLLIPAAPLRGRSSPAAAEPETDA
jgi:ABC-type transporter Mla maintaining outer membrane lipid asymmetry permease subunit MlaE